MCRNIPIQKLHSQREVRNIPVIKPVVNLEFITLYGITTGSLPDDYSCAKNNAVTENHLT